MMNNDGHQPPHFPTPLWQGRVRPFVPRRKNTPVWRQEVDIGRTPDNQKYTTCRVWVHAPRLEFPTEAIFIGFSNANASTFSRLNNPGELRNLASKLNEWADSIDAILPPLKEQAAVIDRTLTAYETQLNQMRALGDIHPPVPEYAEED